MTSGQRYHRWDRTLKIIILVVAAFILSLPVLAVGLNPVEFTPLVALTLSGLF